MNAWLREARDAVAAAAGMAPEELELSDEDAATLLELARIAAHESERAHQRAAALLPRRPRSGRRRPRFPGGRGQTDFVSHPALAELHPTEPHVEVP